MITTQNENRRSNILFVSDYPLGEFLGGSVRVLYEQSAHLAERGHKVHILTRAEQFNEGFNKIENVQEWKYPVNNHNRLFFLKSTFSNSRKTFESLSQKCAFHIINFHQPFSAAGILSSRASHTIPRVYTCFSFSFEEYASRTTTPATLREKLSLGCQLIARKLVEKWVLEKSNHIVVLSDFTREKLFDVYGLQEKKISVIPGGVDVARFTPPEDKTLIRLRLGLPADKFILFTVRNLVPRMGLEALISAFKVVLSEHSDLFLVIGGEGPLGPSLKKQAEEGGVNDFIRFVGFVPEEELPSYYQMADLFILPTTELEGFGLVTVEALASGLPVLGTPIGGTREILARLGPEYLFDDVTPESMATGILKALNGWGKNQAAYKNVSDTCRKVAEHHYSWDNHVKQLEELYFSLGTP